MAQYLRSYRSHAWSSWSRNQNRLHMKSGSWNRMPHLFVIILYYTSSKFVQSLAENNLIHLPLPSRQVIDENPLCSDSHCESSNKAPCINYMHYRSRYVFLADPISIGRLTILRGNGDMTHREWGCDSPVMLFLIGNAHSLYRVKGGLDGADVYTDLSHYGILKNGGIQIWKFCGFPQTVITVLITLIDLLDVSIWFFRCFYYSQFHNLDLLPC